MFKIEIIDSILTKHSSGYPLVKIKLKKENGRIIYSDHFFSKKSKFQTTLEIIDLLEAFDIKVDRKFFITPKYLNRKIKELIGREAICESKHLYKNIYRRDLINIDKIPESELNSNKRYVGVDYYGIY